MRYQSYWFLFYLNQYYNDPATVGKVWNQPMKNQSNDGSATDFCQALMALKGLSASQFYALYFDYALRCATFDFDVAAAYRNNYIGKFDYHAVQLGEKKYQVAYHSAPQSTGFNVIELNATSGSTITTKFTALGHGCALADGDPGNYNNGTANASISAGVTNYNSAGTASYRGFRVGYVFLKNNGTREYYNDNTIHCTGTAEKTENITTTVPANTSRMFLVVAPALSSYVRHPWDDDIQNDDQWPYSFELVNTDATNATIVEKAPEEPEFTKAIDGRSIADVTLTYKVTLPIDTEGYTGASVTLNTGNGLNALCTAFQLEGSSIFDSGKLVDYTASQSNGTIMSCAVSSAGAIQAKSKNVNGTYGHWFNTIGTVADWGNNTVIFTEFTDNYATGTIGQFPGANSAGTTRTVREALVYKDTSGNTARTTFVYNISFKANASPSAYLTEIDYTKPTASAVSTTSATVARAHEAAVISWEVIKGQEATYTLTTGTNSDVSKVVYGLNSITESYLTNSTHFKGYTAVSSVSTGDYVYYYALSQAPTTSSNGFKYYSTASVTTDSDFDTNTNTYVHYYNASGQVVSAANAPDASFKIGYDYKNMKFTVKVKEDCPTGTYTLYLAMLRRVKSSNSTRNYSAHFPITLTVIEKPEETIQVERSAGMGYTTTSVDIDFTAAKEYLGVSTLSTDIEGMEVVLNDRVDVYTVAGTKVKSHVQRLNATEGLPAGIYLVGGKKVIVK